MDKKIEDYLHLYLGCECQLFWRHVNGVCEYERNGTLITVQPENKDQYGLVFKCETAHGNFVEYAYAYADIKPILRPLSDMSEEECREITGYNKVKEGRELLKFDKEVKLACLDYRWKSSEFGNHEGYAYSSTAVYFDKEEWSPENFLYLLSKHFDLFGLHEAGLCLYKTDLK